MSPSPAQQVIQRSSLAALSLGALGVVFGDIGTSPLYAFRECFHENLGITVNEANVFGLLSLIFWTLTLIISIKYLWFVLRADNRGEGGILSLMALAIRGIKDETPQGATKRKAIIVLGLIGASLLYGDGVITPAVTVLSAIEGLQVVSPSLEPYIIPITITIIIFLFLFQRAGTARIGAIFGPIIAVWFLVIGSLGVAQIVNSPHVLMALNPYYGIRFFLDNGFVGLHSLTGVFLVVTGGEALYADMGHFGRKPIQISWFYLAFPALILNYFGQGALLLNSPTSISNPFFLMAPEWAKEFLLIISVMASVIASQALISGVFSVTRQAVQLGYAPRLPIIHTSSREIGQIYIPFINWSLMIGVIWLVLTFKSSTNLASAYGIAVTATMVITAILFFKVVRSIWKWPLWKALLLVGLFFIIDLFFLGTNFLKIAQGGWVPLTIGFCIYLLMSIWKEGRKVLADTLRKRSVALEEFVAKMKLNPPYRVEGSAVYMTGESWGVPIPLLHNLKHNKVMHRMVAILTIKTREIPYVPKRERVEIESLGEDIFRIVANYGFMETPKIKHILEASRERGLPLNLHDTTFVLGRETILPSRFGEMPLWKEKIFAIMSRNAERPTAFFRIPPNQVIEVGIQVEI